MSNKTTPQSNSFIKWFGKLKLAQKIGFILAVIFCIAAPAVAMYSASVNTDNRPRAAETDLFAKNTKGNLLKTPKVMDGCKLGGYNMVLCQDIERPNGRKTLGTPSTRNQKSIDNPEHVDSASYKAAKALESFKRVFVAKNPADNDWSRLSSCRANFVCEKQQNNKCGWTVSNDAKECVKNKLDELSRFDNDAKNFRGRLSVTCGGADAKTCPDGYRCQYQGCPEGAECKLAANASGICVPTKVTQ